MAYISFESNATSDYATTNWVYTGNSADTSGHSDWVQVGEPEEVGSTTITATDVSDMLKKYYTSAWHLYTNRFVWTGGKIVGMWDDEGYEFAAVTIEEPFMEIVLE
jgi:hypothetical protein